MDTRSLSEPTTGHALFRTIFKNFCEKNNINLVLYTVRDHRSNGVVERLIYTMKAKLMAMSFNEPKPTLKVAIDKTHLDYSFNETIIHWMLTFFKTF